MLIKSKSSHVNKSLGKKKVEESEDAPSLIRACIELLEGMGVMLESSLIPSLDNKLVIHRGHLFGM